MSTDVESRLTALEQQVATLQKQLEQTRIAARIRRGLDQADRGQTLPAREAMESLRKKYNIQAQ
jgi:predicted transcriptional regulator